MCQDISLKSCVCSLWPAPRVACPDWKGITTRQSSARFLRGTRSWPAYTPDTSSLATNRTSQVLPTGIPAGWGFVFRGSWISWLWTATPCTSFDWLTELGGKGRCLVTGDFNVRDSSWERDYESSSPSLTTQIDNSDFIVLNDGSFTRIPDRSDQRPSAIDLTLVTPDTASGAEWEVGADSFLFFFVRPPAHHSHHSQLRLLSREGDSCYHQQVQLRPGQLGFVQESSGNRRDKRRRCWPRRSEPTNSFLHSGSRQGSYTGDRWWAVTVEYI